MRKRQKEIICLVAGKIHLRSKRALIEAFIEENLSKHKPNDDVIQAFEDYWETSKKEALAKLCVDEKIAPNELEKLLNNYAFANRLPRDQEIVNSLHFRPKILERKSVIERVADKIKSFIDTFVAEMGGSVLSGQYSFNTCIINLLQMTKDSEPKLIIELVFVRQFAKSVT